MSTQALPVAARARATAPTSAETATRARAGMAMSLATFAMAAASACQAVLYLSKFGTNVRTDGFFVAFALYTTFGVFCQSLRLTSVPLIIEPDARMTVRELASVLCVIAAPLLVITIPLAGLLADVLAPGLPAEGRDVTTSALPLLGIAMIVQLWAAGGATILAVRDRLMPVAGSYVAGAAAGLTTFVALMGTAGELTLGWSMMAMALVTFAGMALGVRASGGLGPRGRRLQPARLVRQTGHVLGRTWVYLAFNMLFVVTLSFASRSTAGDSTVLSYAYLYASYLVAGTSMALGMSRISDLTREARHADRQASVAQSVPQGFRYVMLVVAPALAGLVAAGAPLIHALFPASIDEAAIHTLRMLGALLVPWTVAALLVNLLLPSLFALDRARLVNALAIPLVALHVVATVAGHALFGLDGAVGAMFVAPGVFALALLVPAAGDAAGGLGREIAWDAVRFLTTAAAAFGAGAALGGAVGSGTAAAAVAAVVGSVLYAAGLWLIAADQVRVVLGALRPATA